MQNLFLDTFPFLFAHSVNNPSSTGDLNIISSSTNILGQTKYTFMYFYCSTLNGLETY